MNSSSTFCPFPLHISTLKAGFLSFEHQNQVVAGIWIISRSGQHNLQEAGAENSLVCLGSDLLAGL